MLNRVDLLVDLSLCTLEPAAIAAYIAGLTGSDALRDAVERATILLPAQLASMEIVMPVGWSTEDSLRAIAGASAAFEQAANSGFHLLVLLAPAKLNGEALGTLLECLALDEHFGTSMPRQCDSNSGAFLKLSENLGDPAIEQIPRRALAYVEECYILPEFLQPCFLIRNVLVANLPTLDTSYTTIRGSIRQYLCRCRRAGYRTVVSNRAACFAADKQERQLLIYAGDMNKLRIQYPDVDRAGDEYIAHPLHMHESMLARLFSPEAQIRKSMLLDLRGVPSYMNGTAEAALALCEGLKEAAGDWTISILAEAAATEYHELRTRFPFTVQTREYGAYFTVALRPSQPWHLGTLAELHEIALINIYAMLDTIAWDILLEVPREVGAAWTFMSKHADGIIYNSRYTQGHVNRRFARSKSQAEYVFGHSFHPDDYVSRSGSEPMVGADHIFVIGNMYDHKHLVATVDLLSTAFPFQKIKVLGLKEHPSLAVEILESGNIPASTIDTLFAGAKLIVFPSLYEGFGLPLLKGLSFGKTVIARNSDLLVEIADGYRGPGKLLGFSDPFELVDTVGKVLHNCEVPGMLFGAALASDQQPKTWRDVATGLLAFVERRMSDGAALKWVERDLAVQQLQHFVLDPALDAVTRVGNAGRRS